MGGFWPKMNANGRLDTCELDVFKALCCKNIANG